MSRLPRPVATALILALAAFAFRVAMAETNPVRDVPSVGYQTLFMPAPKGPPVEIAIWYPADGATSPTPVGPFNQTVAAQAPVFGGNLPLVVISHGNGGSFSSHADTALALAKAGFVVA